MATSFGTTEKKVVLFQDIASDLTRNRRLLLSYGRGATKMPIVNANTYF
jgi:hypothetical protein